MAKTVHLFTHATAAQHRPPCRYRFDLTNFRDPIGQADFRVSFKDGREKAVRDWIKVDPKVTSLVDTIRFLAAMHFSPGSTEGSISIAFHDRHGKWISPAVGIIVQDALRDEGKVVPTLTLCGLEASPR